ncbi:translocation/assembly module TamB domain-containing protein [Roseofilum capinflatum]|uniref:Translocation/assembly module TamB domain-containing protein n=1 Tax=Roseofilum capinflatum BLCC-M114 TaxID=3022440 RepID=A0ABT7BA00_9CYAN|nr:translocation/assembly module TamB domain-containing protein [Roseofilum capinflatum]MDJ1175995.1 translocation/assembly module TamB domain-containing protein [Roseofilum capinflatum BLCC-M114]
MGKSPIAYCLLPIAYSLFPIPYSLFPGQLWHDRDRCEYSERCEDMTSNNDSNQLPESDLEAIDAEDEQWEEEDEPRQWRRWAGFGLGGVALLLVAGGGYGWYWVHNGLGPMVAEALSKTVNRPLEIGPVERVSLNSIRFGRSGLPATSTDPDNATVEAVEVKFNPIDVIDNEINLDLTLINAQVYLEEDAERQWLNLDITQEEPKEGQFKINVIKAGVQNATVELVPWKGEGASLEHSVTFKPIRATADFFDEYNRIRFDATVAQDSSPGEVQAKGEFLQQEQRVRVQVRSQDLDLIPLTNLVPNLPPEVALTGGTVNGNLNGQINLQDIQGSLINGTLFVSEVAGQYTLPEPTPEENQQEEQPEESEETPQFDITQVPLYLSQGAFTLQFQDQLVVVEEGSILYADAIPLTLEGGIHLQQGIQVVASLPPVTFETLEETIKTELPVKATGEFQVKAKLEGPFEQPLLVGLLETTQPTQIDRLEFTEISTQFAYANSTIAVQDLKLVPTLGGEILGRGELQLPVSEPAEESETPESNVEAGSPSSELEEENLAESAPNSTPAENTNPNVQQPFLVFEAQGQNVPVDAIAQLYQAPTEITLGTISPQLRVMGPLNDVQAIAQTDLAGGQVQAVSRLIGLDIGTDPVETDTVGAGVRAGSAPSGLEDETTGEPAPTGESATPSTPKIPLQLQTEIRAENVQVASLSPLVPPQLAVPFTGGARMIVPLENFSPERVEAIAEGQLNIAGGLVNVSGRLQNNQIASLVQANNVQLGQFRSELEQFVPPEQFQLPFAEAAPFTGVVEIVGPADNPNLAAFQAQLQGTLDLAGGTIRSRGSLEGGQWEAALDINQVQATRLSPQLQLAAREQAFLQTPLSATVNLRGPANNFSPAAIVAEARADLDIAGGRVNAIAQALNGEWRASVRADGVNVDQLSPQVPADVPRLSFSGVANAQGRLDEVSPDSILNSVFAQSQGFVNVGNSVVNVEAIAQQGQWQAQMNAEQVELDQLGLALPAEFQRLTGAGQMVAGGRLDNFDPTAIQAQAEVLLSKLPILEQGPFLSRMVWNGRSLDIIAGAGSVVVPSSSSQSPVGAGSSRSPWGDPNISEPAPTTTAATQPRSGLQVAGQIVPNFQDLMASRYNFNAEVADFNLAALPFTVPDAVAVQGRVDFGGRIAGTGLQPSLDGRMRLRNVVVNQIAFDPVIEGPIQFTPSEGAAIALKGESDEISAVLDPTFMPESFTFKVGEAIATGQRTPASEGSPLTNFQVEIAQFPLDLVNLVPTANPLGPVSGQVSGNFNLSFPPTFDPMAVIAQGELTVDQPSIGTVEGELLTAKLNYAGGQGQLTETQLKIGESEYNLQGAVNLNDLSDPQFEAEVKIAQGSVQDVLQVLQIFDLEDIAQGFAPPTGRAADLGVLTFDQGEERSLENQLRRFSEILRLQDLRQQERDRLPIPALAQLQGAFDGDIKLSGSLKQGLSANIDLLGENWVWDEYSFNPIIVKGTLKNNVLTLLPVRIESNEGLITFSGQVGGEQQSGQLKVEDVPVDLIQKFIPDLPVDLTGKINTTATILGGSIQNPQVIGKLDLSDGTLNEEPIQEATGNFSLTDGRLRFGGKLLVTGDSPVTLTGSIPSPLPFGSVSPISQEIQLDLNLENEGLSILNVLTRQQVNWVAGTGNVNIKVSGTVDNPNAVGEATIADATLQSQILAEPLNNVTGKVQFNGEKVYIESLTGDFSKGKVQVSGLIPLADPDLQLSEQEANLPLKIQLEEIDLNFQDIYNGGVNGNIEIAGAALEPVLKGNILLTEGKIFPAEATKLQKTDQPDAAPSSNPLIPIFNGFNIDLTDGIAILQPGFVDIRGEGTLTINGPLDDIRADGEIDINRGFINIIATQFRIDREHENKARFIPSQGLDPDLNLRLEASISEVKGSRQPEVVFWGQNEIDDTPPIDNNETETVRIQAAVTGPASRLESNLELTSSPVRSRSEIIALIGGGFLNTIGGGGNTTLALVNIAGSTVLSNLQTTLGDALGLTELRLYPVEDRSHQGAIGLAGEATLDITDRFSTSLGKTLTSTDPVRLRLRYRLSDNLVLRAATDLAGEESGQRRTDSRFQFEFRKQF